jgi:hypothetical protein
MLDSLTPELQEAVDLGITLFAGEAEEHFEGFLRDAHAGQAKPVYNYMHDLPGLQRQVIPFLPTILPGTRTGRRSSTG